MNAPDLNTLRVDFSRVIEEPGKAEAQARKLLDEYGAFLATGLVGAGALKAAQQNIASLITLKRTHEGLGEAAPTKDGDSRFDDGFLDMCRADRTYGGTIYNACRRLMPVHHLATAPELQHLSETLMDTKTLIACTLNAVRIDHPKEDKYLFLWHQDYPYIQDSEDALVYWIPLHEVNEDNGWLRLALGSHKQGIYPLHVTDPFNTNRNGARSLELANPALPEQFPQICVPVEEGEALVFSTLLLHCSQPNRSNRARWTLQLRHGNFESPGAIARNWPGGLIENVPFEVSHPECVVNMGELRPAVLGRR